MTKTTEKTEIKVLVTIKPVKLAELTPSQREQWRRFWRHLLASVSHEVKGDK